MPILKQTLTSLVAGILLISISVNAETTPGNMDPSIIEYHRFDWNERALINYVDECGHNGGSRLGKFNQSQFNARKVMQALRKFQEPDCVEGRKFSSSASDAIATYESVTTNNDPDRIYSGFSEDTSNCLNEAGVNNKAKLLEVVKDPTNIGVFSSVYTKDTPYSESCATFNFYVFRANGTVFDIEFNYTD